MTSGTYLISFEHDLPRFMYEVSYLEYNNRYLMRTHTHAGMEVIVCLSGLTLMETAKAQYLLPPGSVTVFRGEQPHRIRVLVPPYRRWLLHVDPDRFKTKAAGHFPDDLTLQFKVDTPQLATSLVYFRHLFAALKRLTYDQFRPYKLVDDILVQLVIQAIRWPKGSWAEGNWWNHLDTIETVEHVIDTIHRERFATSVENVAAQVGYSESHLRKIFRTLTSMSISDYMRIQRLEYAATLLMDTNKATVSDIAHQLGFQSHAYFSRYFRRHTGYTPTQYQQLCH